MSCKDILNDLKLGVLKDLLQLLKNNGVSKFKYGDLEFDIALVDVQKSNKSLLDKVTVDEKPDLYNPETWEGN